VKVLKPIHGATEFWNEAASPQRCSAPPAAVTATCAAAELRVDHELEVDPDDEPAGMTTTSGFAVI